jgi:hypothetical protein
MGQFQEPIEAQNDAFQVHCNRRATDSEVQLDSDVVAIEGLRVIQGDEDDCIGRIWSC